jgi:hypothetical protein
MGKHAECPRCERLQLEDELCDDCGLCSRCCECDDLDELDDAGGDDDADV